MKITNLKLWQALEPEVIDPPRPIGENTSGLIYFVAKGKDGTILVSVTDMPINPGTELEAWELTDLYNSQDPPRLTVDPDTL